MAKSAGCKCCIVFIVLVLLASLAGGGILAWQLLVTNDAKQSGVSGSTPSTTLATTMSPSAIPTASPSAMPTAYRYPFDQCDSNATACCNGLENLCDWPVNEILFAGVHNAMATKENFIVPNHLRPVNEALEAGYRAINLDVCNCGGAWELCHGYCGLGRTDPVKFFKNVTTFLRKNENEVLIVTMEINDRAGQQVNLTNFYNDVWTKTGLSEFLYVHENIDDPWPTLGTLIENEKRVIAFHYNGPNCLEEAPCPKGMNPYFLYAQETVFDFASVDAILDSENSCVVSRGATTGTGDFLGVNNFVTSDSSLRLRDQIVDAATTNSLDFASKRIQECARLIRGGDYVGKGDVNLLWVDFWNEGDIVELAQEHNAALGGY